MYCPKCSAQNEKEQKYCRKCGLPLSILQLAMEGKVDEALTMSKRAGDALSFSTTLLAFCLLGAIINMFLIPGPWNGYAVLANSIVGLTIALPMIIAGHVRRSRAKRLLTSDDHDHRLKAESPVTAQLLPPVSPTDPLLSQLPIPGSVTEQTTLNLKSPERQP